MVKRMRNGDEIQFEFASAGRIVFGRGQSGSVPEMAAEMGERVFVVTGRSPERAGDVIRGLRARGLDGVLFSVHGEPPTDLALKAVKRARDAHCDMVVGVGGGSVLDTGKVVAALLRNGGDLMDYLEVIGGGRRLESPSAPYIAVPTTAGTGAEVTRNAVLASREHRVKVSMRSPFMLPAVAVVDPELTHTMPPSLTASTGLDALTQLIEPFTSARANPLTDGICREGMLRAARALPVAYAHPDDRAAREEMSLASMLGGLALANAGLGAVHGFAGPLGGWLQAPHGVICACLLPVVIEANVRALRAREPDSSALAKYDEIGQLLTGDRDAGASDAVRAIRDICAGLDVPSLTELGLRKRDMSMLVEKARHSSSMKGNPVSLTDRELMEILEAVRS